jgi:hypothetical protein
MNNSAIRLPSIDSTAGMYFRSKTLPLFADFVKQNWSAPWRYIVAICVDIRETQNISITRKQIKF